MSEARGVESFGKALAKLREFTAMPMANDRDRAGVIQSFEFTFEQCWKAFQRVSAAQGLSAASPRQALQAAVQLGLIDAADEEVWLDMLRRSELDVPSLPRGNCPGGRRPHCESLPAVIRSGLSRTG